MKYLPIIFLLLLLTTSAYGTVYDEGRVLFREQRYETTSYGIYVNRTTGDSSTSETIGYAAMLECKDGDLQHCYDILRYADHLFLGDTENYSFPWLFDRDGIPLSGKESATDGDISLLWSAWAAYERTNNASFLYFYERWNSSIQELDTCEGNNTRYLASGSGIGRWNGCDSYNGVYSAYLMLPLLADLALFDPSWYSILEGTVLLSYEMATYGGSVLPNRCAAYTYGRLNNTLCEINPPYFDSLDAQRWVLWNSQYCARYEGMTSFDGVLCAHVRSLSSLVVNNQLPSGGFEINGTPRGTYQSNTFDRALWSVLVPSLRPLVLSDWNGFDFSGTPCEQGFCIDDYKDPLILLAIASYDGAFFGDAGFLGEISFSISNEGVGGSVSSATGTVFDISESFGNALIGIFACGLILAAALHRR